MKRKSKGDRKRLRRNVDLADSILSIGKEKQAHDADIVARDCQIQDLQLALANERSANTSAILSAMLVLCGVLLSVTASARRSRNWCAVVALASVAVILFAGTLLLISKAVHG